MTKTEQIKNEIRNIADIIINTANPETIEATRQNVAKMVALSKGMRIRRSANVVEQWEDALDILGAKEIVTETLKDIDPIFVDRKTVKAAELAEARAEKKEAELYAAKKMAVAELAEIRAEKQALLPALEEEREEIAEELKNAETKDAKDFLQKCLNQVDNQISDIIFFDDHHDPKAKENTQYALSFFEDALPSIEPRKAPVELRIANLKKEIEEVEEDIRKEEDEGQRSEMLSYVDFLNSKLLKLQPAKTAVVQMAVTEKTPAIFQKPEDLWLSKFSEEERKALISTRDRVQARFIGARAKERFAEELRELGETKRMEAELREAAELHDEAAAFIDATLCRLELKGREAIEVETFLCPDWNEKEADNGN